LICFGKVVPEYSRSLIIFETQGIKTLNSGHTPADSNATDTDSDVHYNLHPKSTA